ncbi:MULTISPECIES: hypothetical protein [Burkholderia]|uniref:Uncharacterized protein n=1 Tax=Burkholderia aenigmatica TaxID=2015348 RepID=A0A6J5ISJ8_9BURK|nr:MULTISPECIES: hypothetical protein [Burkholderia]CAB3961689.1 hypothetical protein BLA3211_01344 [Burkholderia aenigmatica]
MDGPIAEWLTQIERARRQLDDATSVMHHLRRELDQALSRALASAEPDDLSRPQLQRLCDTAAGPLRQREQRLADALDDTALRLRRYLGGNG